MASGINEIGRGRRGILVKSSRSVVWEQRRLVLVGGVGWWCWLVVFGRLQPDMLAMLDGCVVKKQQD